MQKNAKNCFKRSPASAVLLTAILAASPLLAPADDAAKHGAEPGKWTQDYDAAVALSKERNLPLFLKFTGSDWCSWCMLMEKQVFNEKVFQDWAKDNILLVSLDFPRGKNSKTVPDRYKDRNKKLAGDYGVTGFPTYFVLSPDGTRLGQMGARKDYTADAFLDDLRKILGNAGAAPPAVGISPEEREELDRLRAATAEREKAKAAIAKQREKAVADGRRKMAAIAAAEKAAQDAAHDKALADFRALEQKLKVKEAELSRTTSTPAEREAAKAALAKERETAIAEGKRQMAEAAAAAKTEQDAKRNEILAALKTLDEELKAKEDALDAQAETDAARLRELEAKLK